MASELIINSTFSEIRIAFLENGVLTEFFVEWKNERSIVGNVYKGRVVRILPGMDAAFVDIGLEKSAFLYVGDIVADMMMLEEFEETGAALEVSERIEGVLEEGQEIIVQVSREPIGQKGTRATSRITLPGRLLVLMSASEHIGVSRRIEDDDERKRLTSILKAMAPKGFGLIARTACEGKREDELKADLDFLMRMWAGIQEKAKQARAPALLHRDLRLIFRVVRDLHAHGLKRIIVDDPVLYKRIEEFVKEYLPEDRTEIELFDENEDIFDFYRIEVDISKLTQKKIWLKSGGYIVFDYTEALAVIDVNTGRYLGRRGLEDTILKTNLEAVKEIAYQIRLRNMGGIIVVDFIDMERRDSRETVFKALLDALKKDRIKTFAYPISELGLVQLTRKRTRENVVTMLTEPCAVCEGSGYVKSRHTVCYEVLRRLRVLCRRGEGKRFDIFLAPEAARLLVEEEKGSIEHLESTFGVKINIVARTMPAADSFEIKAVA
jgi:ribonuclease G